jgi:hypothetical protein
MSGCRRSEIHAWRADVNEYPPVPRLLSDVGEIRHKRSAHYAVEDFWVLWTSMHEMLYFAYGPKLN